MTDIEMLPLPEPWGWARANNGMIEVSHGPECPHNRAGGYATPWGAMYGGDVLQDHARANVAHVTAAKDAEIEALRAEREVIGAEATKYAGKSGRLEAKVERLQAELDNRWAQGVHTCHDECQRIACVLRRQRDFELKRAERLAEALRECIALGHPRDPAIIAARAALRDHDKEGKDG